MSKEMKDELITPFIEWDKITRLEVIGESGREYVVREIKIDEISVQDGGRTLKLFINHKQKEDNAES